MFVESNVRGNGSGHYGDMRTLNCEAGLKELITGVKSENRESGTSSNHCGIDIE